MKEKFKNLKLKLAQAFRRAPGGRRPGNRPPARTSPCRRGGRGGVDAEGLAPCPPSLPRSPGPLDTDTGTHSTPPPPGTRPCRRSPWPARRHRGRSRRPTTPRARPPPSLLHPAAPSPRSRASSSSPPPQPSRHAVHVERHPDTLATAVPHPSARSSQHATPPCPFGPPSTPQPSRTPRQPYGEPARPRVPLRRVHRAPARRYLNRPEPHCSTHHHSPSRLLPSTPHSQYAARKGRAAAASPLLLVAVLDDPR